MSKQISRRAVLGATVVAILALIGGYVVAATLSGINPTETSQNAGSVNVPGNTIFASRNVTGINLNLVEKTTSVCGQGGATWSSTSTNTSVYMNGTSPCFNSTTAPEWFEEITWTGVNVPGPHQFDTFYITTGNSTGVSTVAYSYAAFSIGDGDSVAFTGGQFNVFLAAGPALDGQLPYVYASISIAVSGT